jgi:type IV secretion system protein VirD4
VRQIADILAISAEETLGGILSYAQEGIDFIRGPLVQNVLESSTFSLNDVTRGAPLAIYIIVPPAMLETHGRLLRLWISVLIAAILRRRRRPDLSTLFLLDEAAQLGTLPQLRQAVTLLRGYGLQTWSFWQDVTQLKQLYPADWQTMVNNCRVLQAFGANNRIAAQAMADLVGFYSADSVLDLEPDEMLLQIAGDEAIVAKRPDYRNDPAFVGMFDDNPLYDPRIDPLPVPRAPLRFYLRPKEVPSRRTPADDAIDRDLMQRLMKMARERR